MGTSLYTTSELRAVEHRAATGLPPGTLMQRAGAAAAAWIGERCAHAASIVVVCGPGNNGGDGYVCATELRAAGRHVTCIALAPPATDDARAAAARWRTAGGTTLNHLRADLDCDVGIDAMFGIGLTRPLEGPFLEAAQWLNALQAGCVALDVPSGLDADTGTWVGAVPGVCAVATVSFLGGKPGLFTADGVDACGDIVLDALGVALPTSDGAVNGPEVFPQVTRPRARNTHKGRFGDVVVIGGAAGMVGAPLLAARAALRLGAGRIYVDAIGSAMEVDPQMPELMFRRADSLDGSAVSVIGCGLGDSDPARRRMEACLGKATACVIDADALNLVSADQELRALLAARNGTRVLTPHPLEAARLLGTASSAIHADRVAAARTLADRFGSIVVLKGAGSVIAAGRRYWINPTGSPALASAGTGDVLAGMIGALLAQGYEAHEAVCAAVWLHGRAADTHGGDVGLVASDIAPLAVRALLALRRN